MALVYVAYQRVSLRTTTVALGLALAAYSVWGSASTAWLVVLWLAFAALALLNLDAFRLRYVTRPFLRTYRRMLPSMSDTEREALEAGTVWWDGEIFSGRPNWTRLLSAKAPQLTAEEQAFIDGPCEELCRMIDDWDITHRRADLPPHVWDFLKTQRFFAMIIPKQYGGLEFSAYAHSCVLVKLASRSATVSSTVAVPNSLGPAELLLHYGTEAQKNHYLPRLARGDDIPCFALTAPRAGSDAASIPDTGVVCKGMYQGREVVGVRLNFSKRYITLAPVATVVGLAFKLFDPDRLLGGPKTDYGITCALIPHDTPGLTIGRRHFPLNVPFQNGPLAGKDVFVPVDFIIGGPKMAGQGWRMLVEQLSVGRCISLPSNATGGAKAGIYATAAYARIRKQFNQPVGKFEGVEAALTRMAGATYIMDAARSVTAGAIDGGEKPSVPSAMLKYHCTELGRQVANDAMDVHGGKGICLGPKNYLGRGYQIVPVAITVEGANILTRSLMILGQGAIRCHPYVLQEMNAAKEKDKRKSLRRIRPRAVRPHRLHAVERGALVRDGGDARAFLQGAGRNDAALLPAHQQVQRAVRVRDGHGDADARRLPEAEGASLGPARRCAFGALHGVDGAEALREPGAAGSRPAARRVEPAHTALQGAGADARIPAQFSEPLGGRGDAARDLPARPHVLRGERPARPQIVEPLMVPSESRDRLSAGIYTTPEPGNPIGLLQEALVAAMNAEPLEKRIRVEGVKTGRITALDLPGQIEQALALGLVSPGEAQLLRDYDRKIMDIINVDDFTTEELRAAVQAEPAAVATTLRHIA